MDYLDRGLRQLGDFIRELKAALEDESTATDDTAEFFFQGDEGGLALDRDDARRYTACLDNLSNPRAVGDRYSKKAVEKLMQTAILTALDLQGRRANRSIIDQRVDDAIQDLRTALKASPSHWEAHLRVEGLALDGLPSKFGKAQFYLADEERIGRLRERIDTIIDSGKAEQAARESAKQSLVRGIGQFADQAVVVIDLEAAEAGAALSSAERELRLTLDVINFYSDILYPLGLRIQAYPLGQLCPIKTVSVLFKEGTLAVSVLHHSVGPLSKFSFGAMDAEKAERMGFKRMSAILERNSRNRLEERILSAMQWAGRATVNVRPEESFLQYAIALESITLGSQQDVELTYRLSLRTALLVGSRVDSRKMIRRQVRDLYNVRSRIVHSGHYEVSDADLNLIRMFSKTCILRVLSEEPFLSQTRPHHRARRKADEPSALQAPPQCCLRVLP